MLVVATQQFLQGGLSYACGVPNLLGGYVHGNVGWVQAFGPSVRWDVSVRILGNSTSQDTLCGGSIYICSSGILAQPQFVAVRLPCTNTRYSRNRRSFHFYPENYSPPCRARFLENVVFPPMLTMLKVEHKIAPVGYTKRSIVTCGNPVSVPDGSIGL